jgi:hypothetical protein
MRRYHVNLSSLWLPLCHTVEGDIPPLGDSEVPAGDGLVNVWGHEHGHAPHLLLHLLSIYLAHVAVLVSFYHISEISASSYSAIQP